MDALQQFHYGQLVHHGEPKGDLRILAKSDGITDDLVKLALETAMVPALANHGDISWGLLRTKRGMPLMLARAEIGEAGQTTYHFIVVPIEVMRELQGNIPALIELVKDPLPTYAMLGDPLKPLRLGALKQSMDMLIDSILELMTHTKNNTRKIEPLLGAMVSNIPLIILNAPPSLPERSSFVHGLLSLLPSSTRFGLTFLLHNTVNSPVSAQIMFMDAVPAGMDATIYDWKTGTISGKEIETDYAKFITGQVRLDPELAMQEAEKLTPTAGWRFNNGDTLAKALEYASYRSKVDSSIHSGMPVEVASVAKILAEDPTLTDENRLAYSRHLINFSLALDDLSHVDAMVSTLKNNPELEEEVYQHMLRAVDNGKGAVIFETLIRWLDNPFSPQGPKWAQLMQKSALGELEELISFEDDEGLSDYLIDIDKMGPLARQITPRIIDASLALADRNRDIPPKLLLLAVRTLDDDKLQKLMASARFMQPQPTDIKRFLGLLTRHDQPAQRGTLMRAVSVLDEEVRDNGIVAFVKMAYGAQRIDLIDERVLQELVRLAGTPGIIDQNLAVGVAHAVTTRTLKSLPQPAPQLVLQLLIISRRLDLLSQFMVEQSRDIYGPDRLEEYIESVQKTFAQVALTPDELRSAIVQLEKRGMRDVPLIAAMLGGLEGAKWAPELQILADRIVDEVGSSVRLLEVIPPQIMMSLLNYQMRQNDEARLRLAIRVAGSCAAFDQGKVGLTAVTNAYKLLESNPKTRSLAIEIVRQYVREAQEKPAQHIIKFYQERSPELGGRLQVSYEFSNLMARMDWLTFATALEVTVSLLQSAVDAYGNKNTMPRLNQLKLIVESIRKGGNLGQQREFGAKFRQLAHSIVILGQQHEKRSSTSDKHVEAIVSGSIEPKSILDVYRAGGAYLLDRIQHPLRTKEGNPANPLGVQGGSAIDDSVSIASNLLFQSTTARPSTRDMWSQAMIVEEIDSHLRAMMGDNRDSMRQMGRNWQRLADLIIWINKNSDVKIIEDGHSRGRKLDNNDIEPENVLELFRFIYGQFNR